MNERYSRRDFVKSGVVAVAAAATSTAPATAAPTQPPSSDLPSGVIESARLVRSGTVSPREMVSAAIKRIEAANPRLNAVVTTRFEAALREADGIDRRLPLAGVPILLKDVALEGEKFYLGNSAYAAADYRFPVTDHFVERLRAAGAVVLGYTNVPEFLSAATTESKLYGPAHNPWDITRSTGGSSGGSGAAVAALLVPAAQSSDGGGSSRIPASANGVFTIKTSRGRTPLTPSGADWMDITSSKSFETRTVRDFALLLDIVAGVDPTETIGAPPPKRPFAKEPGQSPGKLRIGFATTAGGGSGPCHPESLKAVHDTANLLRVLGHTVEEAAPEPFLSDESLAIIMGYWPIKVASRVSVIEQKIGRKLESSDMEPDSFAFLQVARGQNLTDFARTMAHIRDFSRRALAWWQEYDLLLTPMTGTPPPPLGVLSKPGLEGRAAGIQWGRFAPYANITGQPAASVPLHWTPEGLPIGVQLVANIWRDDLLLQVSAQLEQARPWIARYGRFA